MRQDSPVKKPRGFWSSLLHAFDQVRWHENERAKMYREAYGKKPDEPPPAKRDDD